MYLKSKFGDFLYLVGKIPEPDWEVSPTLSSRVNISRSFFQPGLSKTAIYFAFSFGKSLYRNPDGAKK